MGLIMKWSADEQERMQARLEENYERELATERSLLMKEARQEGKEEGIAHKEKEIVLSMVEKQMSKEIISEITKLTLEQIEEIIQSQSK